MYLYCWTFVCCLVCNARRALRVDSSAHTAGHQPWVQAKEPSTTKLLPGIENYMPSREPGDWVTNKHNKQTNNLIPFAGMGHKTSNCSPGASYNEKEIWYFGGQIISAHHHQLVPMRPAEQAHPWNPLQLYDSIEIAPWALFTEERGVNRFSKQVFILVCLNGS